jgi:hypothetical protein
MIITVQRFFLRFHLLRKISNSQTSGTIRKVTCTYS